ncbi:MAG: hypothetical protein RIQ56_933 [Candidatus Parcubacteria bacterium]|jgi:UPF0176 protein
MTRVFVFCLEKKLDSDGNVRHYGNMSAHTDSGEEYIVILFYKFLDISDTAAFKIEQRRLAETHRLMGRILVATEGINATLEGTRDSIEAYKKALQADPRFADLVVKESAGTGSAFTKLEVRIRPEIVTLGAGSFDIEKETAPTISADDLDKLYETNEDFVVLDLRNDYETAVGVFDKTIDPALKNFRDLPEKLPELERLKEKKVVTVCTGGIRCEKATCLLKREGFTNIVQLKDGIHTYMQKYPGKHFKGSLFVFDNRMTTPVVDTADRAIVGMCAFCEKPCEDFYSDDSVRPSRKVICCKSCAEPRKTQLRSCAA